MTDRELMQQALDVIELPITCGEIKREKTIAALREALAEQPEHHDPIGDAQDKLIAEQAAQPSKQWVGLTDEELNSVVPYCRSEFDLNEFREFAFAIGKLLKEKNT